MDRRAFSCHVCAFLATVLWSSAYVFTKVALQCFTSTALGFLRCLVASAALSCVLLLRRERLPTFRELPRFALSGAFGFSIYLLVFNTGSATLTAATSCVIVSAAPLITALAASYFFKERLSPMAWAALGLAFCGVLVLTLWNGVLSVSSGVFWMLAAVLSISGYNILQRMYADRYSPLQITSYSFFTATGMLAVFLPEAVGQAVQAPAVQLLTVVFLGVFPSALAYLLWAEALATAARTSDAANYMYLTPLLSLALGYAVIAEIPGPETFLGGAAILSGLGLFSRTNRRATPSSPLPEQSQGTGPESHP